MKKNNLIIILLILLSSCTLFKKEDKSMNMNLIRNVLGVISKIDNLDREKILIYSQDYGKLKFWNVNDSRYEYKIETIKDLKFEIIENKKSNKVIYLLHGGAFYSPLTKEYNDMMYYISTNSKYMPSIYMLEYSVYPSQYPTAHNEAYIGYMELLKKYDSKDILILGDSAGGHLTVSLMNRLKQENKPLPQGIILFSPWLDIENKVPSRVENIHNDVLIGNPDKNNKELIIEVKDPYYFKKADMSSYYVNPLKGNFKDFPLTYIQVDGTEILLDDSRYLQKYINEANNDNRASIDIFYGNMHDFQLLNIMTKESKKALDKAVQKIDTFYKESNDK